MQLEPKEILEVLHSREAQEHRAQLVRRLQDSWEVQAVRDGQDLKERQESLELKEMRLLDLLGPLGSEVLREKWVSLESLVS